MLPHYLSRLKSIKIFCFNLFLFFFCLTNNQFPYNNYRAFKVFEQIQSKTGQWNINIEILPNGKSIILDRSNTIFISEQIIDLCYKNYSEVEGDNRLAFLLSHEFAHLMNNDLDYDRILNPFNKKLSNEPLEIRKQKEINADLRAVSILNICGFTTEQFSNTKSNIIVDLYKFYGVNNKKANGNYPTAEERTKNINERKEVLKEYNNLYECGINLLLFADENNNSLIDLAVEAFQSFQNYTALTTPELLNNLGLGYLKMTKLNFSKEFLEEPDTILFTKFESGFVVNSEVQPIRTISLLDNSSVAEKQKIDKIKYNIHFNKALNCFKEADKISDQVFIPAKLNQVILYGLNQQYEEADLILNQIQKKHFSTLGNSSLLTYYYNLKGIIEYSLGKTQNALLYFDKALEENPAFITSIRNKNIANKSKSKVTFSDIKQDNINSIPLIIAAYQTISSLTMNISDYIPFGPKDKYNLQYSENDSLKIFTIKEKDSFNNTEIIRIKRGGLKGKDFVVGSKKQEVLDNISEEYSIIFSLHKSFYYYKNSGVIFCFDKEDILQDIIILNKLSTF